MLSSPSGAGKTSIARSLLTRDKEINMSVSATTRPRRPGEAEGKDYYFVDEEKFKTDINKGLFLEYARVFDHYYGTPLGLVQKLLSSGCDVLFDIDWQGTKQLSKFKNLNLIKIYLTTENKEELKKRLVKRDQNSPEEIEKRFNAFEEDRKHWNDYDYVLINKNLDVCFKQIENIIISSKSDSTFFQRFQ